MKRQLFRAGVVFAVLTGLVSGLSAGEEPAGDPRNVVNGVSIYEHGYCDQPYVVVAPDGIWVCVFTTSTEKEGAASQYIVCTRSTDHGRTWSAPVPIESPEGPEASWGMPLLTRYGRVYVFYVYNGDNIRALPNGKPMRADTHGWYCYRYSDDNGLTWSERQRLPMRVTACDRGNDFGGAVQMFWGIGKPVTFGDTAWFAFTKLGRYFLEGGEGWFYRSDNILTEPDIAKVTWELLPDGEFGLRRPDFGSVQEEQNLVPLSNDDLYCVYRTTLGYAAESYSHDGGHHWGMPQYMQYADGNPVKNPRACPRLWRCANGRYLFWYHNHSGRDFNGRNPAWLSGGVERDGRILWSEPEIVLYSNDPPGKDVRYSYPDLIEEEGRYWITTTQKTRATIHEVDAALLEGLWGQLLPETYPFSSPQAMAAYEAAPTAVMELPLPEMPALDTGGFSMELVLDNFPLDGETLLLDGRNASGQGIALTGTGTLLLHDGVNNCEAPLVGESPGKGGPMHLVVTVDGGPDIITFVVSGKLCDGVDQGQYGWHRFSSAFARIEGSASLKIHPAVKSLRIYDRPLTTSQAVRLYQDKKAALESVSPSQEYGLDGDSLSMNWNTSGTVVSVTDKKSGQVLTAADTTDVQSFSLLVKTGDQVRELKGNRQQPPVTTLGESRCRMVWNSPLTAEEGEAYDIRVTANYELAEGGIAVQLDVENFSDATIIEVRYPQVAGLAGFRKGDDPTPARLEPIPGAPVLNTPFNAVHVNYPGGLNMGFVTAVNDALGRGFYMGAHDGTARLKQWRFAMVGPEDNREIAASLVHFPHLPPRQVFKGASWVLAFHDGGWVDGGGRYRDWFVKTFGIRPRKDDWIREKHFYQMIMMMLPEGNINYRFEDVPDLARQGLKYGVDSLQLAGWQRGGHDNGYPYYEPDPRLGTWEDVEKAIRACHDLGVRIYFFANIHCAMQDLDWFKDELHRYVSLNAQGKTNWIGYWGMGTVGSRLAYTVPSMAFVDVNFPGIADPTTAYFRKLADLGADGLHIDKCFPNAIEYNPGVVELGRSPDTAPWQGALDLMARIDQTCRAVKPDFDISFECNWDRLLSYGTATWWAGNMSNARKVFPELTETVGHYWPYDFLGINTAVREGWAVMLSPHKFNRGMGYEPWKHMATYVAETKRICDQYADIIFLGERLYGKGALFGQAPLPGSVAWESWRNPEDGRQAVVFTNTAREAVPVSLAGFEGKAAGPVKIVTPFGETCSAVLPVEVSIPGERFALVVEDTGAAPATVQESQPALPDNHPSPFLWDFESGGLGDWQGDPNWAVDDNSAGGWYAGWQGHGYAWSGKGGEAATGNLRSPVFVLDQDGVEVLTAGWADMLGRTWNRWNYITLNLEDGTELDRVYAPNTTTFTPLVLDGSGHRDGRVYIEAVDDAPEGTYSMLCLDAVRTVNLPAMAGLKEFDPAEYIRFENPYYRIEVGRRNGVIARVYDKTGELDLILEPRLADNWTFALPVVGKEAWTNTEANRIRGVSQLLTSHTVENNTLKLRWDGPLVSVFGIFYDAAVEMTITLEEDQLSFGMTIDNQTDLEIGEVYYPILGGTNGLGAKTHQRRATIRTVPVNTGENTQRIYHTFANMTPFGEVYPEQVYVYPHTLSMPWMHLYSPQLNRGVYLGAHDPVRRMKAVQLLQQPGIASNRADGNWPRPEELDGMPAGVSLNFVHFAYQPPGERFTASPVVLRFHDGDASEAARFYGAWFKKHFGPVEAAPVPAKLRELDCIPFADIPAAAREAQTNGCDALLLKDWKAGGQYNGVADFRPDDGLGGVEGLAAAAQACHDAGIRLFLTFNLQYADPDTAFHKDHTAGCVCTDRWGVPFTWDGTRWVGLNPGAPALRDLLVEQVRALADLGVDGLSIIRFFTDKIDFNPVPAMTADRVDWDGGLATLEAMRNAGKEKNPAFLLLTGMTRDHLATIASPSVPVSAIEPLFRQAMFP